MTKEQLEALMEWAHAMARYEIDLECWGDQDGSYRRAEEKAKAILFAAFGMGSD